CSSDLSTSASFVERASPCERSRRAYNPDPAARTADAEACANFSDCAAKMRHTPQCAGLSELEGRRAPQPLDHRRRGVEEAPAADGFPRALEEHGPARSLRRVDHGEPAALGELRKQRVGNGFI